MGPRCAIASALYSMVWALPMLRWFILLARNPGTGHLAQNTRNGVSIWFETCWDEEKWKHLQGSRLDVFVGKLWAVKVMKDLFCRSNITTCCNIESQCEASCIPYMIVGSIESLGLFLSRRFLWCIEGPKELFACTLCKDVLGVAWQNFSMTSEALHVGWVPSPKKIPVDLKGLQRLLGLCGKPWSVQRIGHVTGSTKRRCVARHAGTVSHTELSPNQAVQLVLYVLRICKGISRVSHVIAVATSNKKRYIPCLSGNPIWAVFEVTDIPPMPW